MQHQRLVRPPVGHRGPLPLLTPDFCRPLKKLAAQFSPFPPEVVLTVNASAFLVLLLFRYGGFAPPL